jgi:hypothetical protein
VGGQQWRLPRNRDYLKKGFHHLLALQNPPLRISLKNQTVHNRPDSLSMVTFLSFFDFGCGIAAFRGAIPQPKF